MRELIRESRGKARRKTRTHILSIPLALLPLVLGSLDDLVDPSVQQESSS